MHLKNLSVSSNETTYSEVDLNTGFERTKSHPVTTAKYNYYMVKFITPAHLQGLITSRLGLIHKNCHSYSHKVCLNSFFTDMYMQVYIICQETV